MAPVGASMSRVVRPPPGAEPQLSVPPEHDRHEKKEEPDGPRATFSGLPHRESDATDAAHSEETGRCEQADCLDHVPRIHLAPMARRCMFLRRDLGATPATDLRAFK